MERHPDLNRALAQGHIAGLLATAHRARRARRACPSPAPVWRRAAGAALVRLGEAIVGDRRPAPLRPVHGTR